MKSEAVKKVAVIYIHKRWFYIDMGRATALIVLANPLFKIGCAVMRELYGKKYFLIPL